LVRKNLLGVALVGLASAACRPITVRLDCPVSIEVGTQFDVRATLEKSGGNPEFDVVFSWTSPTPYRAELVYLAIDGEALEEPETSGLLDIPGVDEGDVTVTAEGVACPDPDIPACFGTLNVEGTATQSGLFGSDHDSDFCEIDLTTP
jgi:hypothetical protein